MATMKKQTLPDGGVLDLFNGLGDLDSTRRVATVAKLMAALRKSSDASGSRTGTTATMSEDMRYALRRLVRGLGSYRDAARQGFALGLTQLLHTFPSISVRDTYALMKEHLTVSAGSSGPEERDVLFGQVFGILAIIRSGRLVQAGSRAAEQSGKKGKDSESDPELAVDLVKHLVEVAAKKSFINELAHQAMIVFVSQIEKKFFEKHLLPLFEPSLKLDATTWSPETLTLAIQLNELFQLNISTLNGKWSSKHGGRIVQTDNIKHLKHACKHSVYAHPKIHSLWDVLLPLVLSDKADKDLPKQFWHQIVEGELFSATHNTQYLGYHLTERALASASAEHIPIILNRAFIRRMLKESSSSPYMQAAAKHIITCIAPLASRGPDVSLAVLLQLAAANKQFDFFTKTRTMHVLLKALDVTGVHKFTNYLKDVFYGDKQKNHGNDSRAEYDDEEEDEDVATESTDDKKPAGKPLMVKGAESSRLWALNKLHEMARSRSVQKDEKWLLSLLYFFFYHAFYKRDSSAGQKSTDAVTALLLEQGLLRATAPPLSDKTRSLCAERFFALLGEVATLPPLGRNAKQHKEENEDEIVEESQYSLFEDGQCADGELWVWKIANFHTQLKTVSTLHFLPESSKNTQQLQSRILDVVKSIRKTEQKTLKKQESGTKDPDATRARGFAILLLYLHTYILQDKELEGAVEDLLECWSRIHVTQKTSAKDKAKSKKKESKKRDQVESMDVEEDSEEPEPMAVLVDILISFLTKPSSQLRDLVTRTFRLFASRMTSSSCQALVEVVTGKRDASLFGTDADDDEDEDSEEDEDEEHDHDHDHEHVSDEENDEDEEEDDDEDDNDDDDDSNKEKVDKISAQSKHSNSDDEEELLDDEAMFKMDEHIVAVLKNMKDKKVNERDTREGIKHFKCRVLDLLEIFVKRQHDSHLIPEMIGPIAAAIKETVQNKQQHELSTKLAGFLKRLFKSKHYPKGIEQTESLHELLGNFVERAMHTKTVAPDLFSSGMFYIIKILLAGKPSPDYKPSDFFDRIRTAWREHEEEREKQAAEDKNKGADEEKGKKRKRGDTKDDKKKKKKEEELDEATIMRRELVRRYKKNSLPQKATGQMLGGLDVERTLYLLRIALKDLMTRNSSCVEPHLFHNLSQNCPRLSWMLVSDYLSYVTKARSTFLKHHIFVILSDLLKRPEAVGENGEALIVALPQIRQAFITILKDSKQLKSDYVVSLLQCLKQVVDGLQERAKYDSAKIRNDLFEWKGASATGTQPPQSLPGLLDALIQARRASQAICGHAGKIYAMLALPLPSELQKSTLSKQERKKQRREEKKKRQEERDRKRFEKLAQKKLKYQLLAQQQAAGGGNSTNEAEQAAKPPQNDQPAANGTSDATQSKQKSAASGDQKKKKSNKSGKPRSRQNKANAKPKEKHQA